MNQQKFHQLKAKAILAWTLSFFCLWVASGCDPDNDPEIDTTPPAAVSDLSAVRQPGDNESAQLTWKAVGDDGKEGIAKGYDLRFSNDQDVLKEWKNAARIPDLPAPLLPENLQTMSVDGLSPQDTYYFGLKVVDDENNWSPMSNLASIGPAGADSIDPVDDLGADWDASMIGRVILQWSAVDSNNPDTNIKTYDIRNYGAEITETTWTSAHQIDGEPSPGEPGFAERMTPVNFDPDRTHFFAMKLADDREVWSKLSNCFELKPSPNPPQPVTNLEVEWKADCSLQITWTDVADDFPDELVDYYELRVLNEMITKANWDLATLVDNVPHPQAPGTARSMSVDPSIITGSQYHFAMKSVDEAGNRSSLSNPAHTRDPFWDTIAEGSLIHINALVEYEGNLVAAGKFKTLGGNTAYHVARWNGSSWEQMGAGLGASIYSTALALLIDTDGSLVAGGAFDKRGDGTGDFNNIARWNGSSWQPIGEGFTGKVADLIIYDGQLVATGSFQKSGDVITNSIAAWNGTSWQALGSGLTAGDTDDRANCLAIHGNKLIVGGKFSYAGDVYSPYVAAWDGSSWSALSGTPDRVQALLSFKGDLYAGVAASPQGIYRLEAGGWNLFASTNHSVHALSTHEGNIVAGGSFRKIGPTPAEEEEVRFVAIYSEGKWHPLCTMYPGTTTGYHVFSFGHYLGDLVTGQYRFINIWDQP